jgi:NAD(P)H-hydrate epimerase
LTIECHAASYVILEVMCKVMLSAHVADTPDGGLAAAALGALLDLAAERDVVALGPGVGRAAETQKLVRDFASRCARPLVLDADGLFPFGGRALAALKARKAATILTPHPGEASRLLGVPVAEINRNRVAAARRLATEAGGVVVLKGAASVIAAANGRTVLNATGGPVLASGGTGDVLTGIVAALLGQGLDAFDAAALGTWVHGRAGDRLAERRGTSGVVAGEIAAELPALFASLRNVARSAPAEPTGLALPFP